MPVIRFLLFVLAANQVFAAFSATATIAISHTRAGSSDLTNFPMLISGSYPQMASVANGGYVTNANGYDVIFTSDSACTHKLNWETEYWNANGKVAYWVNIPTLSHTLDNTIYACVGNAGIGTDQSNRSGVWGMNFAGVWHFPNGTALSANDSSNNGNNGTSVTASATAGMVDGAANFNGSQAIVVPDTTTLQTSVLTVEMWLYLPSLPANFVAVVRKGTPWYVQLTNQNHIGFAINDDYYAADDFPAVIGWQHLVFTYDGSNIVSAYLNGTFVHTRSVGTIGLDYTNLYIGETENPANHEYLTGTIDELRVSNVVQPANWIAADYANQANPSSFYSLNFPIAGAISTGRPVLW